MAWFLDLHEDGYQPSQNETTAQVYVHGTSDAPFDAYAALQAGVPYFLSNGHWLQDATLGPLLGVSDSEWWWLADVKWGVQKGGNASLDPSAAPTLTFSTRGGRQHITQSLGTVGFFAPSGVLPPDHFGAIGVTKNGIQGCDIIVPAFSWELTVRVPTSSVSDSYVQTCKSLTGCANNAPFFGHDIEEVVFLGMNGRRSGPESEFSFGFSSEENVEDKTIGDIEGIEKKGQHYLWVQYEDKLDTDANAITSRPKYVYVERVKPPANFALLGLG